MRLLVIGAKGMLGQEFMKQVQNMTARQHDSTSATEVIGWGRAELDITNEQEVMEKIGTLKPSVIFNCAAYNDVEKAEDEPVEAMKINGEAVGYLARAAVACGATFVHFSTDYVFGGEKADGYKEDDLPNPISKYGESKALGEQRLLSAFCHPDPEPREVEGSRDSSVASRLPQNDKDGARWYIVRTSRLFGSAGTGQTSKKSFPEIMLGLAKAKGRIEVIDAEISSPTYVNDLAQATLKMVGDSAPSGIYHLTNSGSCTWSEYAKVAVESAGVQAEVVPVGSDKFPRKAKRPTNSTLLNTKLLALRPWQDALKEFLSQ